MRHKFKIDKSTKVFKIGELDDNNNINGFGMTYDHDNEKFFVGKFEDGKPTGIYCTNLFFKVKNKIKKCFMLKTNSTKKHLGFFEMLIFDDEIRINVYDDGNKEEKYPYRVSIKENSWAVGKKGSKNLNVMYTVDNIEGRELRSFYRYSPNKVIFHKNIKRLNWVNLDPALISFTIPNFPAGVNFEDKRKTLKAKGIGPCFEAKRHQIKLYFIANNKNDGLSWDETGDEHIGIVDISQYVKNNLKWYVKIDKATNLLKIFVPDLHDYVEMTIDPQSCSFEIIHTEYCGNAKNDKAKVDKDAKITYWSNLDTDDEDTFDFEETY